MPAKDRIFVVESYEELLTTKLFNEAQKNVLQVIWEEGNITEIHKSFTGGKQKSGLEVSALVSMLLTKVW